MYNPILDIDSYKASHFKQYPPGTENVSSYIESRGGKYSHTIFFGLQRFLKKYLAKPITQKEIDQAEVFLKAHGVPFNKEGWEYILEKHNGYLPLKIEAVAEGTLVPASNPIVQVTNTDPNCYWLTSYIETALLRAVWYPTTVATLSFKNKQNIYEYLRKTSDLPEEELLTQLSFKLHDFGARGASSTETSQIGGLAHLVNFQGTDSVLSILEGQEYYQAGMTGYSIPAAEHSTITSWGKEQEYQAYEYIMENYLYNGGVVSMVLDSYDLDKALDHFIARPDIVEKIKTSGGTLVVRPDSGDPATIVLDVATRLVKTFGCQVNSKGYKVLPPYIRIIQGDGVNTNSILKICKVLEENGFSIENLAFGMGAELQQKVNRDTCRFAMKASAVKINGEWHDAFKQPATDISKTSKRGRLKLVEVDGKIQTVREDDQQYDAYKDLLEVVYLDGKILRETNFDAIREKAHSYLHYPVDYFADK
ncbi:nicotinate phosphoribosyltransferase [Psittacicella melopsittaci]|uniref:Nicotinamide phosphoribosyltransferase n=1 Tax=Psittacicella melopsittaci TaxID=2028576 RepID=A0A3A1Y390_9GAMM|nr:nicotinate phosphoribosyltransferase [Psittacicella melopsittaci]RIY31769.1 nicotinate phosphoribosyltransferase [Psittacicella melopsittaci]